MKSRAIAIAAILWVGAGTMIFMKPDKGERAERTPSSVTEETAAQKSKSPGEQKEQSSPPAKRVKPLFEQSKPQLASAEEFVAPTVRQAFNEFFEVQQKVLPKPQDRELKKRLLNNSEHIASAKAMLLKPALTPDDQALQNVALDYLFEAMKSGNSQQAVAALKAIVADKTIESNQIEMNQHKAIAEIKAEILYELSSERPEETSSLQASLPGPVSQRIWRNVQGHQESNLAESQALRDQRP